MRHRKKINHLSRKAEHRKAMLANMAVSLIKHKRIKTTVAKAKALRMFVEPIITRSKPDRNQTKEQRMHNMRLAYKKLRDKEAVQELFQIVGEKVAERNGGYTRILKIAGNRIGDGAPMAYIELVDFNTTYRTDKEQAKKRRTRRGRRRKKSEGEQPAAELNMQQQEQQAQAEENKEAAAQTDTQPKDENSAENTANNENQTPGENTDNKE